MDSWPNQAWISGPSERRIKSRSRYLEKKETPTATPVDTNIKNKDKTKKYGADSTDMPEF
jgi:hypothetical protein